MPDRPATERHPGTRPRPLSVFLAAWFIVVAAAWALINDGSSDPTRPFPGFWPPTHPYYFNLLYAFVAIGPAAIAGIAATRAFGLRSRIGLAAGLFAAGIVVWALGNTVWFWYNSCGHLAEVVGVLGCASDTETPYPSVADVGFLALLPLWGFALVQLWQVLATTTRDLLRLAWIPAVIAVFTGWLMLPEFTVLGVDVPARSLLFGEGYSTAETVFSSLYLASDVVILSLAAVLLVRSRHAAGGLLFRPILAICLSCALLYAGDVVFDIRVANDTYYNGDGSDGLYFLALFTMIVALQQLRAVHARLSHATSVMEGAA